MAINTTNHTIYQLNGITAMSNEPAVNKRNAESGHLIIDASSSNMLTIESVTYAYNKQSVNDILDTQFNYFKFPVQVVYSPIDNDVDIAYKLESPAELEKPDPIYARYKPSEDKRIAAGGPYKIVSMGEIEEGLMQKRPNQYYITKEIKNSGKDLRFRIVLEHRYDSYDAKSVSGVFFSLMKTSVANGLNTEFIPFYEQSEPGLNWWDMKQYQVKKLKTDNVILNRDFEIGDTFSIGSFANDNGYWYANPDTDGIPADSSANVAGPKNFWGNRKTTFTRDRDGSSFSDASNYHTINAATSYWVITDASKNVDKWNQEIR